MTAENTIRDEPGATLSVGGKATFAVTGQPQEIVLDGQNNVFAGLHVTSKNAEIHLAGDTTLVSVVADNLVLSAGNAAVTLQSAGELTINQQAEIRAGSVVFDVDSISEVGGLSVITTDTSGSSIEVRADITPRLISGNPTNATGAIEFRSPNVVLGEAARQVSLVTYGDDDGGAIAISGVDDQGNAIPGDGVIQLIGDVTIDSTNGGASDGADIVLVAGDSLGQIVAADVLTDTSLMIDAGVGDVTLGQFIQGSEINSLTITSANDVNVDDIYVGGNTIDIAASGDLTVTGTVVDAAGDISIVVAGDVTVAESISAGGSVAVQSDTADVTVAGVSATTDVGLVSTVGQVSTLGAVDGGNNVSVTAETGIILGSNVAAGGTAALVSNSTISSAQTISSGGGGTSIVAVGSVDLASDDGEALASSGGVKVTSTAGDVVTSSIRSDGDISIFSLVGSISQRPETVIDAGNAATLSAETGIAIATVNAAADITLVITQAEVETGDPVPTFSRVNPAIALGQGQNTQDISSSDGAIIFLAPVADVGSAVSDQNFVQRSPTGIFYGLEQGQFFSDDIGATGILSSIPDNVIDALNTVTEEATNVGGEAVVDPVDLSVFKANLSLSASATASAGETSASSSSRSTAASQRDDEEDVEEVDEVAFQNLRNYDENPQGIRLPEDQAYAVDDEGTMYFNVTVASDEVPGDVETFTLFALELDLGTTAVPAGESLGLASANRKGGFRPAFYRLPDVGMGGD